jgi:aerobic carbon-monoxide dehydrogenase medium subunit
MKSAPFQYVRAQSLAHALSLLAEYGDRARVLAGGQSLLPTLALRLDRSEVLVDVQDIPELQHEPVRMGDVWQLAAMTRHVFLEHSEWAAQHMPLLARAAPWIAHTAIRHRGTLGGSLNTAHPASEWPACLLALGARVVLHSQQRGRRRVELDDFFVGICQTCREPDELLVTIEVPVQTKALHAFREVAQRKGDYAAVGLAAVGHKTPLGSYSRWVLFGVADRPLRCQGLENIWRDTADLGAANDLAQRWLAQHVLPQPDSAYSAMAKLKIAQNMVQEVMHEWHA